MAKASNTTFVAHLSAFELLGLVGALEEEGSHDTVGNLDSVVAFFHGAVFVELHDRAFHESALSVFLGGFLSACLLAESLILLVNHFVGYGDVVEGQSGVCEIEV